MIATVVDFPKGQSYDYKHRTPRIGGSRMIGDFPMHIWTNRPYEAMWDHLDFLTHSANVERLLTQRLYSTGGLPPDSTAVLSRKAAQVAYSIRQGHDYFRAADSVSITTSPVLYFYGFLSLSKALLVAKCENLLLNDIRYHGLYTRPTTESQSRYSEAPDSWSIEREFANTREGVFKHLTRLIHNFEFPDRSTIEYKDLLEVEPETSGMFQQYYGALPRVQYIYDENEKNGPYQLSISVRTMDHDDFEQRFPQFKSDFRRQAGIKHGQALVYVLEPKITSFPDYCGIYHAAAGGRYLIGGLKYKGPQGQAERYFRPEVCDYVNMFILCNCARYKQEFWGEIVEGKTGALGFISLYVSVARSRFPNFILNQLFGEEFSFGPAGRLV